MLTVKIYKQLGGVYSISTFQNHFGSWHDAVVRIGLTDGHSPGRGGKQNYSNEDYYVELQRVWEELGRQPNSKEMRRLSSISPQAFQCRFGSWTKAIHSFCADRSDISTPCPVVV